MSLTVGDRLGHYEVLGLLGAGGMGEVYRARDRRLGRTVAVKVLSSNLPGVARARHRLEREARALSSFNHPNACALFDVGHEGEIYFLVMEYVEGETLAERIARRPQSLEEVMPWAIQIADALDRAHRQGLIHRDLKPSNIMLTKSGAKLMDFGVARALRNEPAADDSSLSTATTSLTAEGEIVGTLHYMSPEQLVGNEPDVRSDVWSFGATIYEALTGTTAFDGTSRASLFSSILNGAPLPLTDRAPTSPPGIERLIQQCLAKDPNDRWQTMGDLRRELQWLAGHGRLVPAESQPIRRWWRWAAAIALLVVAAGAVMVAGMFRPPRDSKPVTFTIASPPGIYMTDVSSNIAMAPDGHAVAFTGSDSDGHQALWVRSFESVEPKMLPGTGDAGYPFWSPDSRNIGFFAGGKLKCTPAIGGPVEALCDAPDARGGSWGRRGVIVFAPSSFSALQQVDAAGGAVHPAAPRDSMRDSRFPCFLPDGKHFLEMLGDSGFVSTIGSPKRTFVGKFGRSPVYAEPGFLVFAQEGYIVAQRFDARRYRLEGKPTRIALEAEPRGNAGSPAASVSRTGLMAFPTILSGQLQLVWRNRENRVVSTVPLPAGDFSGAQLSPDGRQVVLTEGRLGRELSLWTVDLEKGMARRLTFDHAINRSPQWSPDGRSILFLSNRHDTTSGIYLRRADGSGTDSLVYPWRSDWPNPTSWGRTGEYVTFERFSKSGYDIWKLPMVPGGAASPYLDSAADEREAEISPDGHWLAYQSNETGRFEIYVQSFPTPGTKYQVTATGGTSPNWSRDGSELHYRSDEPSHGSASTVSYAHGLAFSAPHPPRKGTARWSAETPAGLCSLSLEFVRAEERPSLTIVQGWPGRLPRTR